MSIERKGAEESRRGRDRSLWCLSTNGECGLLVGRHAEGAGGEEGLRGGLGPDDKAL